MTSQPQQICSRFVEPEKLAELRTQQEIEIMNNRPLSRDLPPPPVLPPYGPLEKISGRLESFRYEVFREYFDADAYRTSTLPDISDRQRGAAAAVAIAAGSPGVGTAIMAESESSYDTAEYVQGVINGKPFSGWVGVTRVRAGDNVDMIVEWQHDHYQVYAIALPDERIVSICPECNMGHIAHMLWRIKNMVILTVLFFLFFLCVCIYDYLSEAGWEKINYWNGYPFFLMVMTGIAFILSGLMAFFSYKAYAPTCCKLAEEIFYLLGMKKTATVNLNKKRKEREQELKEQGKWYDPGDKSKPACPSNKFTYSNESWYYY